MFTSHLISQHLNCCYKCVVLLRMVPRYQSFTSLFWRCEAEKQLIGTVPRCFLSSMLRADGMSEIINNYGCIIISSSPNVVHVNGLVFPINLIRKLSSVFLFKCLWHKICSSDKWPLCCLNNHPYLMFTKEVNKEISEIETKKIRPLTHVPWLSKTTFFSAQSQVLRSLVILYGVIP